MWRLNPNMSQSERINVKFDDAELAKVERDAAFVWGQLTPATAPRWNDYLRQALARYVAEKVLAAAERVVDAEGGAARDANDKIWNAAVDACATAIRQLGEG
jgi:hypothetical protein